VPDEFTTVSFTLPPCSQEQLNGTDARQKLTTETPMTLIITAETRLAVLDEAGSSSTAQSTRCHGRPFGSSTTCTAPAPCLNALAALASDGCGATGRLAAQPARGVRTAVVEGLTVHAGEDGAAFDEAHSMAARVRTARVTAGWFEPVRTQGSAYSPMELHHRLSFAGVVR
jgi:hypothetical protein